MCSVYYCALSKSRCLNNLWHLVEYSNEGPLTTKITCTLTNKRMLNVISKVANVFGWFLYYLFNIFINVIKVREKQSRIEQQLWWKNKSTRCSNSILYCMCFTVCSTFAAMIFKRHCMKSLQLLCSLMD